MTPLIILGDNKIQIPSGWEEVSVKQFMGLIAPGIELWNLPKTLSILTDHDEEFWLSYDTAELLPYLLWLNEEIKMDSFPVPDFIRIGNKIIQSKFDIRYKTYGQKYTLQSRMNQSKEILDLIPVACSIYLYPLFTGQKFDGEQVDSFIPLMEQIGITQAYAIATDFCQQIRNIVEVEKQELSDDYDSDEIQAGIKDFERYDVMATVDALAFGRVMDYESIFLMDYNTIFVKLMMNRTSRKFGKRYREIKFPTK